MDIYISSLPLQITILILILLFPVLSYKRPRFTALLFPVLLPLYLVKLYLRPATLVQCCTLDHSLLGLLNSIFVPAYQNIPVLRPDFKTNSALLIPTNLLEILIIIFLIINIPLIIRGIKRLFRNSIGKYFIFSVIFFLFATAISTVYAINFRVALGAAKSWFFLPVLLFFAFVSLLESNKFREKFLYSIGLSGVFIVLTSVPFLLFNLYTYDGRLAGIFLSPNHLAMALIPGIIALLIILPFFPSFARRGQLFLPLRRGGTRVSEGGGVNALFAYHRTALYILLAFELFILYFTYSYGTWLGLFAAILILFVIPSFFCHPDRSCTVRYKRAEGSLFKIKTRKGFLDSSYVVARNDNRNNGALYFKILLAMIFIFVLLSSQLSNPKLAHILNGDYYSSLHSRLMIWQSAWAISKDHWLTGVGADNFQQAYLDYQSRFTEPYIEWSAPQPHNVFLAFLTQLGITGLISFIFILTLTLLRFVIPSFFCHPDRAQRVEGSLFKSKKRFLDSSRSSRRAGLTRNDNNSKSLEIENYKLIKNFKFQISNLDPLTLWALSYFTYFLIHGLVDTPYFKNDLAILFWLALAVLWAAESTHTADYVSQDK